MDTVTARRIPKQMLIKGRASIFIMPPGYRRGEERRRGDGAAGKTQMTSKQRRRGGEKKKKMFSWMIYRPSCLFFPPLFTFRADELKV